jgi:hypothetical protein
MVYIYILQLEQGKYYIGKTNNPQFRIESHFNFNGSAWTIKYKPIKLIKLIPNCDDYDEDKYTRIYMDKYGIQNVRGGSYVKIDLDTTTIIHLQQMSNGTNNKCFICSKEGHFAKDCEENECWETESEGSENIWCCDYCEKELSSRYYKYDHMQKCKEKYYDPNEIKFPTNIISKISKDFEKSENIKFFIKNKNLEIQSENDFFKINISNVDYIELDETKEFTCDSSILIPFKKIKNNILHEINIFFTNTKIYFKLENDLFI